METMNAAETSKPNVEDRATSIVDALRELGSGWAAYGLKVGKLALEHSAETLERTAKLLDTLAVGFEKKPEDKTVIVDADAHVVDDS